MRPSCHKPGGLWGHHVTNLEVNEAGSNEKSSTVNLAIGDLAASPLYHFTFINLGTCVNKISWLRKPIFKTLWRLTHKSPGFIEPRISTVQLVNWTRPMLPKHLRLQWQQKQTTEMCPFCQGIWTQMARPCREAGFEISNVRLAWCVSVNILSASDLLLMLYNCTNTTPLAHLSKTKKYFLKLKIGHLF